MPEMSRLSPSTARSEPAGAGCDIAAPAEAADAPVPQCTLDSQYKYHRQQIVRGELSLLLVVLRLVENECEQPP